MSRQALSHSDTGGHSCLWSRLKQSGHLSRISFPSWGVERLLSKCSHPSWHPCTRKWHPWSSWARSPKCFLQLPSRSLSFTQWFPDPLLHNRPLLQAGSTLSRHTTAIPHVTHFTVPLICGEPVVSPVGPAAPCRTKWLFPGPIPTWSHSYVGSSSRLPIFFCLMLPF